MIDKTTKTLDNADFDAGEVLLIDKIFNVSSFSVVGRIKRILQIKKAGHAGTLDPFATGLLIVCTGKMTKQIYEFQDLSKTYTGTIKLGEKTPSMDAETEPIFVGDFNHLTKEIIVEAKKKFEGEIEQIPPMYSAIKYNGKSLYKFARKGREIKREPRKVNVARFEIKEVELPFVKFEIECSKGTYIRVLANDLGEELGCGGYLTELRRTRIGFYKVEDALLTDELKELRELDASI
ncbi:MAG: tRNA pseudouridine(55) synthase TruB [Ignavibacteriae bacterium]|nr:tRNA pseudouridine(55) synthase TruB [Ignavibacteriota bacterium]|tara:strand:+ start:1196 stop:1903 length:708 start_codon:yes stop_codon:yes gene_type:complete